MHTLLCIKAYKRRLGPGNSMNRLSVSLMTSDVLLKRVDHCNAFLHSMRGGVAEVSA